MDVTSEDRLIVPKPSPGTSTARVLGGAVAAVAVIGVGIGAFVIAGGRDVVTPVPASETTVATVVAFPFDPQFIEVDDPVRLSFAAPEDWVVVRGFPVQQAGADVVDDPELAAAIDSLFTGPPPLVVVVDPRSDPELPTAMAAYIQPSPEGTSAVAWAEETAAAFGDQVTDVDIRALEGDRSVLTFKQAQAPDGVLSIQVFRSVPGGMLAFLAVTDDPEGVLPVIESVAGSVA